MTQHILVVEDSATQRERARLLLEADGYRVDVARNGREALERLRDTRSDLIISDVVMPEMDGYALCRAVKASPETRRIPVVLLTAQRTPSDILRGLEHGADNFITKPYEDAHLLARVRTIFHHLELRKGLALYVEVTLTLAGREIVVSADKQQIIELLFSTADELGELNARLEREVEERTRAQDAALRAKAEAERANAAKSEFLSRMSHELRTPLNAILGFAQLFAMRVERLSDRRCVDQILRAGRHLLGLIDEVLDLSRVEAGRIQISPEPVLVGGVISQVLDLAEPLAAVRHIELRSDRTPLFGRHVWADSQRLHQVLLNLVSNGIKYNREGGQLTVACEAVADTRLRITVTDTGPGIPPAVQERLFTPFDRLGAERLGVEGTGLGLALSRRLAEVMGGSIGFESMEGKGSTFWVELAVSESPVDREAPVEPTAWQLPVASPRSGSVLYIDDNPSNLELVEWVLAEHLPGLRLISAVQGRLGLELARQHVPDVILLDLHLPDVPGEEVLREIQADPELRRIPVIVLSADATRGHVGRLKAAGARAYLSKPLDLPEFVTVLQDALPALPEAGVRHGCGP